MSKESWGYEDFTTRRPLTERSRKGRFGSLSERVLGAKSFEWFYSKNDDMFRLLEALRTIRSTFTVVGLGHVNVNWASEQNAFGGVTLFDAKTNEVLEIQISPKIIIGNTKGEALDAVHGVALHEASHALHTPGNLMTPIFKENEGKIPEAISGSILNWIEDIYIEHRLAEDYPGFANYLSSAWEFFLSKKTCDLRLEKATEEIPNKSKEAIRAALELLVTLSHRPDEEEHRDRCLVDFPEIVGFADEMRTVAGVNDPEERRNLMRTVLQKVYAYLQKLAIEALNELMNNEMSAKAMSEALKQAIKSAMRALANKEKGKESGDDGEGDDGEGDDGELSELDKELRNAIRSMLEEAGEGLEGVHGDRRKSPFEKDPLSADIRKNEVLSDEASRRVQDFDKANLQKLDHIDLNLDKGECDRLTTVIVDSNDTTTGLRGNGYAFRSVELIYQELLSNNLVICEELKRRLRFRDAVRNKRLYGQRSGEIDEPVLGLLPTGKVEPFWSEHQSKAQSVDLVILIDESGSMAGMDRWKMAATSTIAIEYATRHLKSLRLRVYGFTSDFMTARQTTVFRHFDSRDPARRDPSTLGYSFPKSNNADGLALAAVLKVLSDAKKPGVQPILLMISDGQPSANDYPDVTSHVRKQVMRINNAGIAFAHLQIGDYAHRAAMSEMYGEKWQLITHVSEIPQVVTELVMKYLQPRVET